MRYALINSVSNTVDRFSTNVDPSVQTKAGFKWLPCPPAGMPAVNAKTEIVEGPTYVIGESSVTEVWTKRLLTALEIESAKDQALNGLRKDLYNPLIEILLVVVNEARNTKAKLNALIDATNQSATVAKYPANQTTQIDAAQLATAIKNLLT